MQPGVLVDLVGVEEVPGAAVYVISDGILRFDELRAVRVPRIAVHVLRAACRIGRGAWFSHSGGIPVTIDPWVDSQGEKMLVVVCIDVRIHSATPGSSLLVLFIHDVGVQAASQLEVELDGAVHHETPVDAVLVVSRGEDLRNDQLGRSGDDSRGKRVPEVRVLAEKTVIFLVDANCMLDGDRVPVAVHKVCIQVVDHTFAVAAKSQRVSHVSGTILADIQGVLSLVWVVRIAVRNNHLRERDPVEKRAYIAVIVVPDVRENNSLPVVEANMHREVVPADAVAVHLKGHPFGLRDVDWLLVPHLAVLLDHVLRHVVRVRDADVDFPPPVRNIDVYDLLQVHVHNRAEIERMRKVRIVLVVPVVHQCLLEPSAGPPSLIIPNSPRLAVNVIHLVSRHSRDHTLLNHVCIVSDHILRVDQVLNRQDRLHSLEFSA